MYRENMYTPRTVSCAVVSVAASAAMRHVVQRLLLLNDLAHHSMVAAVIFEDFGEGCDLVIYP